MQKGIVAVFQSTSWGWTSPWRTARWPGPGRRNSLNLAYPCFESAPTQAPV